MTGIGLFDGGIFLKVFEWDLAKLSICFIDKIHKYIQLIVSWDSIARRIHQQEYAAIRLLSSIISMGRLGLSDSADD